MVRLKEAGAVTGKVVFVALGVPYGIAIIVNSVYRWPQSDPAQSRVSKQLRPSRVLKLNYAIWEQLGMIKWIPLLVRGTAFYSQTESSLKNIPFGENSLTMDVWLPEAEDNLDRRPVIFFIYGGAWGSGRKYFYAKFGQELASKLKAVVVIPDYRIYPKGNMHHMVSDVIESIHKFRKLSVTANFSADVSKMVIIGHSAGAHLSAMAAIHIASEQCNSSQGLSNLFSDDGAIGQGIVSSEPVGEQAGTDASDSFGRKEIDGERCTGSVTETEQLGRDSGREEDIDLSLHVKGVIGIGGVYHIMDHYYHERKRGVEDISPMWRAAEGLENFEKYSPTSLVPVLTDDQKKRLPPHILIHGMNDKTVPVSSSSKFASVLSEAGVPTIVKLLPEGGHAELVMDMMEPNRKWYSVMMGMVMEGTMSFLQENTN